MDDRPQRKVKVNLQNLYREEMYTDMRTAALRQLTPVKPNGEIDKTRKFLFVGQTNIMSPQGLCRCSSPSTPRISRRRPRSFPT